MKQLFLDIKNRILSIPKKPFKAAVKFTGAGVNDVSFSEQFTEFRLSYAVTAEVVSTDASGDVVNVSDSEETVLIKLTGDHQPFKYGVYFKAASKSGHTVGDKWVFTITTVSEIKFCQVWNNQVNDEMEGKLYDYPKPSVFIEIVPGKSKDTGNGIQVFDELMIMLHIVHEFYDTNNKDGKFEQNLEIFALKQRIYNAVNLFQPTNCSTLSRCSEEQSYDHDQIYHYKQGYLTAFSDASMDAPFNGTETNKFEIEVRIEYTDHGT